MRPSALTTRVLLPTRVRAAIGCLDMAKARYKGAKVHAGARKLQIMSAETPKNRIGAHASREKEKTKSPDSDLKWSGLARAKRQA